MAAERILILGGTGFVGSATTFQLVAAGHEVHLAGRREWREPRATFHELDLLTAHDFDGLISEIRPTHLLHFAWVTEPGVYWTSPLNLAWVAGSLNLATAFAKYGGQRMVVAGTCAEYRWGNDTLDELRTPIEPATPYGQAKACLFRMLSSFAPHLGLSIAWGRIFFPLGPGEKPGKLISDTVSALLEGRSIDLSEGRQSWDFMHVDEVAGAFIALLFSEIEGAVNIASGDARSVRSVVEDFADRLDGRHLLRFGARSTGEDENFRVVAAVRRLRDEVGFAARYSWDDAIDRTIAAWGDGSATRRSGD